MAKAAGVSISTVSLVWHEKGKISAQTIDKARTTIAELGYRHNVAAANLRANTSNIIGMILAIHLPLKVTSSIVQGLAQRGDMVFVGQPADQEDHLAECVPIAFYSSKRHRRHLSDFQYPPKKAA